MEESHGDAESGGCARGFVTSSTPSAWPWQRCCTTRTTGCTPSTALHRARTQPPGPGEVERVTRSTRPSSGRLPLPRRYSSCTTRKMLRGECGPRQCLSRGRKDRFNGTLLSTSSISCRTCRLSMCLCRRWVASWWISCRISTRRHLTSRLSPCPRSLWTESRSVLRYVVRRRRNSWWKCRLTLLMPLGLLSPLLLEEVFQVFSQIRIPSGCSALSSRSWTFLLEVVGVVVLVVVFKVYALDRIQQRMWSRLLIFQLASFLIASIA